MKQRLLGLNQLLWYYADMEKKRCPTAMAYPANTNVTTDSNACIVWRRFAKYGATISLAKYLYVKKICRVQNSSISMQILEV